MFPGSVKLQAVLIGIGAGALGGLGATVLNPALFWRHAAAGAATGAAVNVALVWNEGDVDSRGLGSLAVIARNVGLLFVSASAGAAAGFISAVLP